MPYTLQYSEELDATLSDTFDVDHSTRFANTAIDFADTFLERTTVSAVASGAGTVDMVTVGRVAEGVATVVVTLLN